ncbi:MAG: ectoine/hydroxyectoine ABC transporter permease subunit EhuC [Pirellulales bacterium]
MELPPPLDLLPLLLPGLWMTLLITAGGCVVALVAALAAGLGRRSQDVIIRSVATIYIETFRGTSALVQLYWFYFALPLLLGIRLDAVLVGILVLGLNIGAYGAEVVRAAINAVSPGQRAAAKALNLSPWQTMRHVVLPQAVVMMLPPFGNLLIELLKSTALVSMITVSDLTRVGIVIRDDTHRTVAVLSMLLVIYFLIASVLSAGMRALEKRMTRGLDYGGSA